MKFIENLNLETKIRNIAEEIYKDINLIIEKKIFLNENNILNYFNFINNEILANDFLTEQIKHNFKIIFNDDEIKKIINNSSYTYIFLETINCLYMQDLIFLKKNKKIEDFYVELMSKICLLMAEIMNKNKYIFNNVNLQNLNNIKAFNKIIYNSEIINNKLIDLKQKNKKTKSKYQFDFSSKIKLRQLKFIFIKSDFKKNKNKFYYFKYLIKTNIKYNKNTEITKEINTKDKNEDYYENIDYYNKNQDYYNEEKNYYDLFFKNYKNNFFNFNDIKDIFVYFFTLLFYNEYFPILIVLCFTILFLFYHCLYN